jgi:hypothetical protein
MTRKKAAPRIGRPSGDEAASLGEQDIFPGEEIVFAKRILRSAVSEDFLEASPPPAPGRAFSGAACFGATGAFSGAAGDTRAVFAAKYAARAPRPVSTVACAARDAVSGATFSGAGCVGAAGAAHAASCAGRSASYFITAPRFGVSHRRPVANLGSRDRLVRIGAVGLHTGESRPSRPTASDRRSREACARALKASSVNFLRHRRSLSPSQLPLHRPIAPLLGRWTHLL